MSSGAAAARANSARRRAWASTLALILALVRLTHADPLIEVLVDRDEVFVGDSIEVTLQVRDAAAIDTPDHSAITNSTVLLKGTRNVDMRRQEWSYNAAPRIIREFGRDFVFEVTPSQAGTLTLGPWSVRADDTTVSLPGPTVRVQGVEQQDWVRVTISSTRERVMLDEAFEVALDISIRALPPPYDQHHPLDPQNPPRLTAPFLEDAAVEGLAGPDMQATLQGWVEHNPGAPSFHLNNHRFRMDPFSSMFGMGSPFEERKARFMLPRQSETTPAGLRHVYRARLTYVAKREGTYTFGPADLRGSVITAVGVGGSIRTQPVLAIGNSITVQVTPPPEEGKPESFIGAIGTTLVASATLDSQTCSVGDPLTLTLRLTGDLNFDQARAPRLSKQPGFAERFRLYDDTVQTDASDGGGRQHRYTLRPLAAGTYELPPIEIAYYDARERAYRTVTTTPLPLRVNEAAQLDTAYILSTATNGNDQAVSFSSTAVQTVAGITMAPAGASKARWLSGRVHAPVLFTGPLVLLLALTGRLIDRLRIRRRRRHASGRQARARAERAIRTAGSDRAPLTGGRLRVLLAAYLGERFGVAGAGLGPADVRVLLDSSGRLSGEQVTRATDFYIKLFNAEFDGSAGVAKPAGALLRDEALAWVRELDEALQAAEARPPTREDAA